MEQDVLKLPRKTYSLSQRDHSNVIQGCCFYNQEKVSPIFQKNKSHFSKGKSSWLCGFMTTERTSNGQAMISAFSTIVNTNPEAKTRKTVPIKCNIRQKKMQLLSNSGNWKEVCERKDESVKGTYLR